MANDSHENQPPPRWIDRLLLLSALLALSAVLFALFFGDRGGHGGVIADITVNLGGRAVREHCTTCHPQGRLPGSGSPHPEIAPHSWQKLGCTGCHLGEGMALDETISHGLPGRGARKVLAGADLQARCYACHELAPLRGAEKAWRGHELFMENACDACHSISAAYPGGRYGPDLSAVGSTLGIDPLLEAIRDPRKAPANSIMPRFPLSAGQARSIAWFLKSRVSDPLYATPMEVNSGRVRLPEIALPVPEGLPPEGALLAARRCLACHKFGEEDGRIAPDLTWIGSMEARDYLEAFLANPARLIPGAIMPQMALADEEREKVVEFLVQRARGPLVLPHAGGGFDFDSPAQEGGPGSEAKHLYMELCQRCHAAAGDGFGLIQPNIANFPRAFAANAEFFRRAPDERLRKSIEKGVPGTSMPPYGRLLEKEQVDALLDLAFAAFVGIPRSEKRAAASLPDRPAGGLAPQPAEARFGDLCVRCHGRSGTGKGPEALDHLPRPRNLTNRPYCAALPDERIARAIADGIPGTAMPSFRERLNPGELWGLVEKVRHFSGEKDERIAEPRAPLMAP